MEECKRNGIGCFGPDVNESYYKFAVNDAGAVSFWYGAVKDWVAEQSKPIVGE